MMCWENAVSAEQLDRLPYLSNNQKKINKYAISKTKVIKRCTSDSVKTVRIEITSDQ